MKKNKTIKFFHPFTKMVAHRGLSGIEVENTLPSFAAAGNRSYYAIETDVHQTKDNELVVCHDSNLFRLTGLEGLVIEDMTLEEIKKVELKDKFGNPSPALRIPMFKDYLDCCIRYNKRCVIELKDRLSNENIDKLLNLINERNYINKCIFISFNIDNLIYLRSLSEDYNIQLLIDTIDEFTLPNLKKYHFDLDMRGDHISVKQFLMFKHNHIKINIWTVNTLKPAMLAAFLGVNYLTTNILE